VDFSKEDVDAAAAMFLARRDYSRKELRGKLIKKELPVGLVDEVLDEYTRRGWLDDVRFAELQAGILARKQWGPVQIQAKLVHHGVERGVARSAVDALEVVWEDVARDRVSGRFLKGEAAKAYRHLVQRGFSAGVSRKVAFSLDDD